MDTFKKARHDGDRARPRELPQAGARKVPAQFERSGARALWDGSSRFDGRTGARRRSPQARRQGPATQVSDGASDRARRPAAAGGRGRSCILALLATRGARRRLARAQRPAGLDGRARRYLMVWLGAAGWMIALAPPRAHPHHRVPRPAAARVRASPRCDPARVAAFGAAAAARRLDPGQRNLDIESSACRSSAVIYVPLPAPALATLLQALGRADRGLRAGAWRRSRPSRRRPAYDDADGADPRRLAAGACCSACRCSPRWGSPPSPSSRFGGLPMTHRAAEDRQSANSFPILAAPLFILMGNIMNSAGITERIFAFATAVRRLAARRPVPRQHPRQRDLRRHVGLGGGGRRRRRHARDQGDARRGLRRRDGGRDHGRLRHHRADHPAVAADGDLRRVGRRLDRRAVPRRRRSRPADGGRADGDGRACRAPAEHAAPSLPGHRRVLDRLPPRLLGADDAGGPVRRHDRRHLHADRGGGVAAVYALFLGLVRLSRLRPARAAADHRRHGRDHRRRDGAGDDGGGARLVPVAVAACRRRSAPR